MPSWLGGAKVPNTCSWPRPLLMSEGKVASYYWVVGMFWSPLGLFWHHPREERKGVSLLPVGIGCPCSPHALHWHWGGQVGAEWQGWKADSTLEGKLGTSLQPGEENIQAPHSALGDVGKCGAMVFLWCSARVERLLSKSFLSCSLPLSWSCDFFFQWGEGSLHPLGFLDSLLALPISSLGCMSKKNTQRTHHSVILPSHIS